MIWEDSTSITLSGGQSICKAATDEAEQCCLYGEQLLFFRQSGHLNCQQLLCTAISAVVQSLVSCQETSAQIGASSSARFGPYKAPLCPAAPLLLSTPVSGHLLHLPTPPWPDQYLCDWEHSSDWGRIDIYEHCTIQFKAFISHNFSKVCSRSLCREWMRTKLGVTEHRKAKYTTCEWQHSVAEAICAAMYEPTVDSSTAPN